MTRPEAVYLTPELGKRSHMSTRELIDREVAVLPDALQREVYDFVRFLRLKSEDESFNGLLLSESALARVASCFPITHH